MGHPRRSASFKLGPWRKGINNVGSPADLGDDELVNSDNFVFDAEGKAETRPGLVQRISGTSCFGLFGVNSYMGVFFDAGKLYKVDVRSWVATELASGYSVGRDVSWAKIGPRVYFTNGVEHGRIHIPTWEVLSGFGTPNPELGVTLSSLSYGSLNAGRYFVGISYVDSFGEESSIPELHFHEITSDGGINVALSGTVPSSVDVIRVYLTEADGDRRELFRVAEVDSTETSIQLDNNVFGSPAETLFLDEIPVPDLITAYNGYLFFSIAERVWSSQAQRWGLYHIDDDEIGWYPEDVTVLERGMDGIWIVADVTYAYIGSGPKDFRLVDNVHNYPASKFSGKQVEGELFGEGLPKDVPFWFSTRGPVIGLLDGQIKTLTKGRAEPDQYGKGASGMVKFNGVESVMTALDDFQGPRDSVSLQDSFDVRVISRGISES